MLFVAQTYAPVRPMDVVLSDPATVQTSSTMEPPAEMAGGSVCMPEFPRCSTGAGKMVKIHGRFRKGMVQGLDSKNPRNNCAY